MGKSSKIKKSDLKRAIKETGGNVSQMSGEDWFNCARQTIYNRVRECDLWGMMEEQRRTLFEMAEGNIFDAVADGDTDLSKFVVTHFPGGVRWSSKTEVSFSGIRLSDDTLAMMDELGLEPESLSAQFEEMVRQAHVEAAVDE